MVVDGQAITPERLLVAGVACGEPNGCSASPWFLSSRARTYSRKHVTGRSVHWKCSILIISDYFWSILNKLIQIGSILEVLNLRLGGASFGDVPCPISPTKSFRSSLRLLRGATAHLCLQQAIMKPLRSLRCQHVIVSCFNKSDASAAEVNFLIERALEPTRSVAGGASSGPRTRWEGFGDAFERHRVGIAWLWMGRNLQSFRTSLCVSPAGASKGHTSRNLLSGLLVAVVSNPCNALSRSKVGIGTPSESERCRHALNPASVPCKLMCLWQWWALFAMLCPEP